MTQRRHPLRTLAALEMPKIFLLPDTCWTQQVLGQSQRLSQHRNFPLPGPHKQAGYQQCPCRWTRFASLSTIELPKIIAVQEMQKLQLRRAWNALLPVVRKIAALRVKNQKPSLLRSLFHPLKQQSLLHLLVLGRLNLLVQKNLKYPFKSPLDRHAHDILICLENLISNLQSRFECD